MCHTIFKRGRFVLEYSLFIAVIIGVFLGMQNYLKRSMQGQIKSAAEQIIGDPNRSGDQYDYGFTDGREYFDSRSEIFEVTTAGWNHPTTHTETEGHYASGYTRSLKPLTARPPKRQ
jgi:hypothetical protein